MNFCYQKSTFIWFGIISCLSISNAFQITQTSINPNQQIQVGETVRLSCRSDYDYEYCIWRHKNRVCNFEWKKAHNDVKKQTCTELNDRAHFRGSYESHECSIDLENTQLSDQGEWSCEMESYVWGLARGSTHKKSLSLHVIPKITTTLTTSQATSSPAESSSKETTASEGSGSDKTSTLRDGKGLDESISTTISVGASTSRSERTDDSIDDLQCPKPWIKSQNGNWYHLSEKIKRSFEDTEKYCINQGGHVANISSKTEYYSMLTAMDVDSFESWINNGTQLEILCDKNQAFSGDTTEETLPWCSFNKASLIHQDDRCISMISGRDVQFTYASCEILHSALCESTEKLCHTQVTSHYESNTTKSSTTPLSISSSIKSTKGDDQLSSAMNTTTESTGSSDGGLVSISVSVSVVLVLVAAALILLVCRTRHRKGLDRHGSRNRSLELKLSSNTTQVANSGASLLPRSPTLEGERFNPHSYLKQQIKGISYDVRREVKRASFVVGEQIGAGNFSSVCKGTIYGLFDKQSKTPVAIKTLRAPINQEDLDNMLGEIKVLGHVKPHLNLVSMIGSCTTEFKKCEQLWVLLEYCEYGDLRNYLLGNRWNILSGKDAEPINSRCLIKWAYDIANGMHFLESKSIMHGDLAARNILLDEDPTLKTGYPLAKISDFGLAKEFYNKVEYEKVTRMVVPWKWMAYEYLTEEYFTLKSDVWSFAVLVWEIFSFGRTPYGFQEFNEVLQQLENGFRLQCPKEVLTIFNWSPLSLYEKISERCFEANPEHRASFSEVVDILERELTEEEKGTYVQMSEVYQSTHTNNYLRFGRHLSTVSY